MIDVIKKTMLMGVGLAAMTKDKVEEYARDLADSAKLSSEKGKKFVEEVVERAERESLQDILAKWPGIPRQAQKYDEGRP